MDLKNKIKKIVFEATMCFNGVLWTPIPLHFNVNATDLLVLGAAKQFSKNEITRGWRLTIN